MIAMTVNKSEVLEKLKRRHSIIDENQDDVLNDIIDDTISHYLAIANQLSGETKEEVPERHTFIITDVASKRYVRRGSEGMEVERVDQYQAQYSSPVSDFDEYMLILENEYMPNEDSEKKGKVTFY